MEKRDIRINYDMLETLLARLDKYRNALQNMYNAVDKVNKAIGENDSKSIRHLNKKYKKVKKRLTKSISEVYTLYESLDNYVNDMTGIIKPLKGTTRVGRNDIYMNLQTMFFYMTEISALRTALLPETTATDSMTEEDKQKMQRNYQKFQLEIQGRILQDLTEDIRDFKDTLKKDYYKEKVVKYENEDDEHRWRTAVVRQCLSSPLDRLKQNAIDWATFVSDVANGAKMAVLDLIEGLASLSVIVYYGWRANVAMLVEATASNPPDWVDDALEDYDKHVYPLTTILTDPVAVVESLAQTASDTYEKEGGTYAGAYLITDFLLGKALSGAGKADEITDADGMAKKAEDIAKFSDERVDGKSTKIHIKETRPPYSKHSIEVYTDGYAQINKGKIDIYIRGKVKLDVDAVKKRIKELESIKKTNPNAFSKSMKKELQECKDKLHNYQRSQEMSKTLKNAGIEDNVTNNEMITKNLLEAAKKVTRKNLEVTSYIQGSKGKIKVVSRWKILSDGTPYLVTVILKPIK